MTRESQHEAADAAEEAELEQAQQNSADSEATEGVDRTENMELSIEQLLEKLAEAEMRADQAKDDLLRVKAEMQNLRRRTEQDVEKAHKYGQEKFSSELLTVMDNLERALDAASEHENETVQAIYEGVDLTLKSFTDCFKKFNIEEVNPLGEPFDPALHQAMSIQDNSDVEPNTVIAVMQKGYTLHGRVIRPAMVIVSKGTTTPSVDETA